MAMTREQLLAEAMALNDTDRELLVDALWRSSRRAQAELDQQWAEEAERRIDEIEEGGAQAIPGDQVMREARRRLQR